MKKYAMYLYNETAKKLDEVGFVFFAENIQEAGEWVRKSFPNGWYGANICELDDCEGINRKYGGDFMCFAVREYYTEKEC